MRVLLVEDDHRLAVLLRRGLEEAGLEVDVLNNGPDALVAATATPFDAIILDVLLPGGLDGFRVCAEIRARNIRTPVLMLTARGSVEDRVGGLESGADDYLVKPFAFREVLARTRALARRHLSNRAAILKVGPIRLDTSGRETMVQARAVELTTKEFAVLEYLMHYPGRVLTRTQIEDHVWNYDFAGESNLVEVYIARLRRKLAAAGTDGMITTIRGAGYRLERTPK